MTSPDTAPDAPAPQTEIEGPRPAPVRASRKSAPPRKRANRSPEARYGELWAKCPERRVPVKDVELFKHLLNCPGAEVRRAEWVAQQAASAVPAAAVEQDVQQ